MTVCIGCVDLSAAQAESRFWAHDSDRVLARLLLRTASPNSFADDLAAALAPRGLILNEVTDVAEVTEKDSPELREVAQSIDAADPHLFGRMCDAAKSHACAIAETPADAVLPSESLWAVLDGVAWPGLPAELAASGDDYVSLYTSTDEGTLASGPWLVHLREGCTMLAKILGQPHDSHVGILLTSDLPMADLRRHLRRFTMAHIPTDTTAPVYFRFYDPRVLLEMSTAMSPENLSRFMAPISSLYAMISARAILPDHAHIARLTTPFDTEEGTAGRLAKITLKNFTPDERRGAFYVTPVEFSRFERLQRKKAEHALARKMSHEFAGRPWSEYRQIGKAAPAAARLFNMSSVKQVMVLARAMMLFGRDFWEINPEAAAILKNDNQLPWQKKDALVKWMVYQGTGPQ